MNKASNDLLDRIWGAIVTKTIKLSELQEAFELVYQAGMIDGALGACDRMLARIEKVKEKTE